MTEQHWAELLAAIRGEAKTPLPIGFIIDCPWLPNWYGVSILEYFQSDEVWFQANKKAIETFPECIFLPGFWSEFGMCTEPSAFGSKCQFPENEFPFAEKIILSEDDVDNNLKPDVTTDGLLPFMLNRLVRNRGRIEAMGHQIKFSVSRGPLNIASFLMGTTEFLMMLATDPEKTHRFLRVITDFLIDWHARQRDAIDSIDGMLVLDDIVGFVGEDDFKEFAFPYLKELFDVPVAVKLFHNDADCRQSVKYYPDAGINLYNPGIQMSVNELHRVTDNCMTILGSIPPRDVLASGTPDEVRAAVKKMLADTTNHPRLLPSCAGGMPPGVTTENLRAFIEAVG
ncbi:MAG: uroporphyrinogen decarboxylase family protein [Rhizomicrobium sp.]|nr:uroporphyrinogen decarboxylase family protein [Rhizomicrobium sp.]